MAQITLAGAGNAAQSINLINPRFQAEALRAIRGYDIGVLDNSFYTSTSPKGINRIANSTFMWPLTTTGGISSVVVGRGMATAYGYDIQSEAPVTLSAAPPASGVNYYFIYLEWDLHNTSTAVGSLKIRNNGASSTWTPTSQDNLITNPVGTYQMILYRLTVNSSGAIMAISSWEVFGVKTIRYNLRSENANRSEEADHATNADLAINATYANGNQAAGTIDARLVAVVSRLDKLGFRSGAVTFCGTSYGSTTTGGTVTVPVSWINGPTNPYTYESASLVGASTINVKSVGGSVVSAQINTIKSAIGSITFSISTGTVRAGSGSVTFEYSAAGTNGVQRQGNFVEAHLKVTRTFTSTEWTQYISAAATTVLPIIQVPVNFRPASPLTFYIGAKQSNSDCPLFIKATLGTDGKAYSQDFAVGTLGQTSWSWDFAIHIGYEAPPIT